MPQDSQPNNPPADPVEQKTIQQELTEALAGQDVAGQVGDQETGDSSSAATGTQDQHTTPAGGGSADAGAAATQATDTPSLLDRLKQEGIELGGSEDDAVAALKARLAEADQARQRAEELEQFAGYGKLHLEHAPKFQQWLAEQEKVQQAPPADPHAPPEFNPAWLNQVQRNDAGELVPINGGTPETVAKLQKHLEWREQFFSNPHEHIQSFVDRRAEEIAKGLVQSEISKITEQIQSQYFVANNREWLFEKDFNPDGSPKLTKRGAAFRDFVSEASQAGLTSQQQQDYAMRRLTQWDEAEQLRSRIAELEQGGGQQAQQQTDPKEKFLQDAADFSPNSGASTNPPPASTPQDEPPQNENLSLDEQMRAAMKAAGITDEAFNEMALS